MYAHKRLSRTEERSFTAGEKKSRNDDAARYAEKIRDRDLEPIDYAKSRTRRGFN
jgi:magnesium chelatase subunit I